MMKYFLTAVMLLSGMNLFGQVRNFKDIPSDILDNFDKMGTDGSDVLNSYESEYLNEIFKDSLNGFDFTSKKVGFIRNTSKLTKEYFFMHEKERFYNNNDHVACFFYVLDAAEKERSGGYDIAIFYWSIMYNPKKIAKILNKPSNPKLIPNL